jgi:branched-chain amino acid transport system permease protein
LEVSRSRRGTAWTGVGALVVVAVLAILPYEVYSGTTAMLDQAFIILTLASMWNLLAGYAGLVSVGQQAFLGLGAYFVLIPAMHGISPFIGIVIAAVGAGVAAIPLWWLVSRLRTGYFAIATWVLASAIMLFIERFPSIGGGTGMALPGLTGLDPTLLSAYTYWAALAVVAAAIGGVYLLLRSRLGLVLTAIRDDETAARGSGARVGFARALVFVVAAVGCGAAGGVLAIQQLGVQPGTSGGVFSVQWTAEMAFAVIIGGLGTIEGPVIGTIVYMVLQQTLQHYNAWYLIILGLVAIVVTLFARRGLWGTLGVRLLPTGYHLRRLPRIRLRCICAARRRRLRVRGRRPDAGAAGQDRGARRRAAAGLAVGGAGRGRLAVRGTAAAADRGRLGLAALRAAARRCRDPDGRRGGRGVHPDRRGQRKGLGRDPAGAGGLAVRRRHRRRAVLPGPAAVRGTAAGRAGRGHDRGGGEGLRRPGGGGAAGGDAQRLAARHGRGGARRRGFGSGGVRPGGRATGQADAGLQRALSR